MFTKISHLTLSLLALMVVGCHSQGQTGSDRRREDLPDGLYGWEGIASHCSRVPDARFRDFKKECECPSLQIREEIPEVFAEGSCSRLNYSLSCEGPEGFRRALLEDGIVGLNTCLRDVAQLGRTHFSVEVAGISERDALAVARYFDTYRERFFAKLWPTREEDFFNATVTVVVGQKKIDADFVRAVLAPPARGERKPYRATYFEPEALHFQAALGHPLDVPKGLESAPSSLQSRFAVAEYVKEIAGRVLAENLSQFQGDILGDCRQHCTLRHRFAGAGKWSALREKSYLGGAPYRDIVWFDETSTRARVAAMHLNPRGGVSAILFITPELDNLRDEVGARVEVYDRKWKTLGAEWIAWVSQYSEVMTNLARVPLAENKMPNSIVLCENLEGDLLQGDYSYVSSGRADTSLLGWLPGSFSWARYLDPLLELEGGAIPNQSSMGHGKGVAQVIRASNRSARLIPISFSACLERFSEWAPEVAVRSVKVVQLAGSATWDERACRTSYPLDQMIENQKQFLWVMAAGNSASRNPRNRCPQSAMRATKNAAFLVVAGGNSSSLWADSDFGTEYADLAAAYHWNSSVGTSYASPRVAAAAAKIAEAVPALSAVGLRAVLLFSVDIPYPELDIRSGGQLNGLRALELARSWEMAGYTESQLYDHRILAGLLEKHFEPLEVERYITLWRQRGLL